MIPYTVQSTWYIISYVYSVQKFSSGMESATNHSKYYIRRSCVRVRVNCRVLAKNR